MRLVMTYLNALLLGVILGMIFVATVQQSSSPGRHEARSNSIVFGYELLGAKDQRIVLLIPGTTMHVRDWSPESHICHVNPVFRRSISTIAISVSVVRPAEGGRACMVRK